MKTRDLPALRRDMYARANSGVVNTLDGDPNAYTTRGGRTFTGPQVNAMRERVLREITELLKVAAS